MREWGLSPGGHSRRPSSTGRKRTARPVSPAARRAHTLLLGPLLWAAVPHLPEPTRSASLKPGSKGQLCRAPRAGACASVLLSVPPHRRECPINSPSHLPACSALPAPPVSPGMSHTASPPGHKPFLPSSFQCHSERAGPPWKLGNKSVCVSASLATPQRDWGRKVGYQLAA